MMFLLQSPEGARRAAANYLQCFNQANAASAGNRKFSLPPSHLVPSFGVTPFEYMEKLHVS